MNALVFVIKIWLSILCLIIMGVTIVILSPILIPYLVIDWVIGLSKQINMGEQL